MFYLHCNNASTVTIECNLRHGYQPMKFTVKILKNALVAVSIIHQELTVKSVTSSMTSLYNAVSSLETVLIAIPLTLCTCTIGIVTVLGLCVCLSVCLSVTIIAATCYISGLFVQVRHHRWDFKD